MAYDFRVPPYVKGQRPRPGQAVDYLEMKTRNWYTVFLSFVGDPYNLSPDKKTQVPDPNGRYCSIAYFKVHNSNQDPDADEMVSNPAAMDLNSGTFDKVEGYGKSCPCVPPDPTMQCP